MFEAGSFFGQDSLLASNCCYKATEIVYRGEWIMTIYIVTEVIKLQSTCICQEWGPVT